MSQPELTIIMPVYNIGNYLKRALDALLNQENMNFKLLIINDGSTDNTLEIAESYQDKFRYFKILNQKNSGPSAARNLGLDNVDTTYLTFHDGDDYVAPGYVAYFLRAFHKHPNVDMVTCGYWIDRPNRKPKVVGHPESGVIGRGDAYLKMTNVFGSPVKGYAWNKAYKTAIIRKYHLRFDTDVALLEDQIFNVKYVSVSSGIYYTQHPYYHYWQRSDSLVHQPNLKKVPDNFKANYRVWSHIIQTSMETWEQERLEERAKKRAARIIAHNSDFLKKD